MSDLAPVWLTLQLAGTTVFAPLAEGHADRLLVVEAVRPGSRALALFRSRGWPNYEQVARLMIIRLSSLDDALPALRHVRQRIV
jgi:hypothetical protein